MIMMNIAIDSFLVTFGGISAIVVWVLIILISIIILWALVDDNKEDNKEDNFDWCYQDEKCFKFVYDKDNSWTQVYISKDKLKSLIEDKNIDLYYSEKVNKL